MHFFISTEKYVKGYQKSCPWEKKSQKCKKSCQIALFNSKSTTESLNSYTVQSRFSDNLFFQFTT